MVLTFASTATSKSFIEILNEHIYVVIFALILLFVIFTILTGYIVQKCVVTKR